MSTSITFATAVAKVKALGEDTVFYASDLGIAGGTINGLDRNGYIEKTGNTKSYMIEIGDNLFKRVSVYEWRVHDRYGATRYKIIRDIRQHEFERWVKDILSAAEALKALGY